MKSNSDQRSLILIRGLPGSGKSTLANVLSENGKHPVFSIDSFFTDDATGEYNFEYQNNHLAYKKCEEQTLEKLKQGCEKIFVDNTFVQDWEMEPYKKMADEYGYTLFVLTVENRHNSGNIHNISDEQVGKMVEKFKVKLTGDNK